jgi:hypothetical protein
LIFGADCSATTGAKRFRRLGPSFLRHLSVSLVSRSGLSDRPDRRFQGIEHRKNSYEHRLAALGAEAELHIIAVRLLELAFHSEPEARRRDMGHE